MSIDNPRGCETVANGVQPTAGSAGGGGTSGDGARFMAGAAAEVSGNGVHLKAGSTDRSGVGANGAIDGVLTADPAASSAKDPAKDPAEYPAEDP
ncbi:MAG: hypothetical protein ACRYHA_23975, partial [Janthinobacterium lividum]